MKLIALYNFERRIIICIFNNVGISFKSSMGCVVVNTKPGIPALCSPTPLGYFQIQCNYLLPVAG